MENKKNVSDLATRELLAIVAETEDQAEHVEACREIKTRKGTDYPVRLASMFRL